ARGLLAKRLSRHGLAVSGATLATLLSQNASACVPASVVSSTVKAAAGFAAGAAATAGAVSTKVAALAEAVLKTMLLSKLKIAIAVLLVLAAAGGGLALVDPGSQAAERAEAAEPPAQEVAAKPAADLYGDPLPAGA